MVEAESIHEANAFWLLDANPAVLDFREQPCEIRYVLDGIPHSHFPDILVKTAQDASFWEVKTAADAKRPETVERTRLLAAELPAYGYSYQVVVAEDLRMEPRLSNVRRLVRLGKRELTLQEREHIRQVLSAEAGIDWGAAEQGFLGPNGREILARLFLEGVLVTDLHRPLGPSTIFRAAT